MKRIHEDKVELLVLIVVLIVPIGSTSCNNWNLIRCFLL